METVAVVFIWISAVARAAFMMIEMFPWDRPFVFNLVKLGFTPQLENEKVAAKIVHNAGLYNGLSPLASRSAHFLVMAYFTLGCSS